MKEQGEKREKEENIVKNIMKGQGEKEKRGSSRLKIS
jgi:hypothetical protein